MRFCSRMTRPTISVSPAFPSMNGTSSGTEFRRPIPRFQKGKDGVAADVAGAAGDEDGNFRQYGGLRARWGGR